MKNEKVISIITVSFNSEKTISDTIESVLMQDYQFVEYIIVDGGSTDKTIDIIKGAENRFRSRNMSFRWVSEPDSGIYNAMNKGIKMATGEVIGIINSDDYYYDNTVLSTVMDIFISGNIPSDIVHGNMLFVNQDKTLKAIITPGFEEKNGHYFRDYSVMFKRMIISHPSTFILKSSYETYGLYDESFKVTGDYDLLMRFIRLGAICSYIDKPLSVMRDGGVSNKNYLLTLSENYKARINNGGNIIILTMMKIFKILKRKMSLRLKKGLGKT